MTTDWPDDNPSAHRALAIYAQTVPLGAKSNQADTRTVTVTATTAQTFGPFTLGQIGNELACSFDATNGSAQTLLLQQTWIDSVSGITTDIDTWGVRSGPAANPHIFRIYGRTKADTCSLKIDNSGTGFDAHITYVWLNQSRVYERETFKTLLWGQNVGDTLPNKLMDQNLFATSNPTINAGASQTRNLPAWAGNVNLFATTASGLSDLQIEILDQGITGEVVYNNFTDTRGDLYGTVTLPRSQCELIMTNHNAANQVVTVTMIIADPQ